MCYEIWKSQTFVILSFDYPVSQDFVEICTPFVCFVFWDHFLRKLYILHLFFVLFWFRITYFLFFFGGRQNIMLLCERNYWTDWQVHRSVFTAWNSFWIFLRIFVFDLDMFSILISILIEFWLSCKNVEVNFDFFPSNH